MPNQFRHNREWKREVAETCARLCLCAVLPEKWTANTKIKTVCQHGAVSRTAVHKLIERQFCCKSQASKAHNPEVKCKAAKESWTKSRDKHIRARTDRWLDPENRNAHSKACKEAIASLKEDGWTNPGWGRKPSPEDWDLPGILGFIEYEDEDGLHLKVGITRHTLEERYGKRHVRTLAEHTAPLGKCFVAEQTILAEAEQRGWRLRSSTTTELIHPDGYSEVKEWVLRGGVGDTSSK